MLTDVFQQNATDVYQKLCKLIKEF